MTLPAQSAPPTPIADALASLGDGFRQIGGGIASLCAAFWAYLGQFAERALHHIPVLAAGIVIGLIIGLAAWGITAIWRHTAKSTAGAAPAKGPPAPKEKSKLQTLAMPELEKQLNTTPDGLTQAEATKRLAQYGPNELPEKKTNLLLKFLKYFWGPIPGMIEVAVVLSALVRHWPDFFIILVLLFANAIIGFVEERAAGNAIDALKARLAIKARFKRDGKWTSQAAKLLVPGDVIRIKLGDIVPADARLLQGDEVSVDQSALTGESLPATKKPGDFYAARLICGL